MKRFAKWLALVLLAGLVVLGAAWWLLQHWLGTDDFKARVVAQASAALGVPVQLGRISVDPWPVPAVALDQVLLQTRPALSAERVEVRLVLRSLLAGRVELATVLLRRADLPQAGLVQLQEALRAKKPSGAGAEGPEPAGPGSMVPRRVVLDGVTWRSVGGEAVSVDADAHLDAAGLPDALTLKVVAGVLQGAQLQVKRQGSVWQPRLEHAGGTVQGRIEWQPPAAGAPDAGHVLTGQLETRNLELSALRAGAPGPMAGRLEASTTLNARAANVGALLDALQTQSRFTVRQAVLHGLDLAKAVRTVGLSRGGETRLDSLSGQLATRGQAIQLSNLAASSGLLSASGNVAVSPRHVLSGRIHVNLGGAVVGTAVGVPLVVGGTLDAPEVTLTRAAMLGAALGTAVLPGVGTGAGAQLGDKLGEKIKGLFGK